MVASTPMFTELLLSVCVTAQKGIAFVALLSRKKETAEWLQRLRNKVARKEKGKDQSFESQ